MELIEDKIINIIEEQIIDINEPVSYIDNLFNNLTDKNYLDKMYLDEIISIKIRFIFKYHNISVKHFINYQNILLHLPITSTVIKNYYIVTYQQFILNEKILLWKKKYNNIKFWKLNSTDQHKYLINLKQQFLAIFDGCIGNYLFHLKINDLNNTINESIHIDEMILRLEMLCKLFKYNFFIKNKIKIYNLNDFIDLPYNEKIIYMNYLFLRINKILTNNIVYFDLLNIYQEQYYYLINPRTKININIIKNEYDLNLEDINFIFDKI